jgi:iron complex transport system permease protein
MNNSLKILLLGLASLIVLLICPFAGMEWISMRDILSSTGDEITREIFWTLRVPRVLTAFLAGSTLALGGMTFQALFRNPLATPFTLGVASGASLGASIAVTFGFTFTVLGVGGTTVAAFLGALLAMGVVYGLTRLKEGFTTATMLLSGVAISFFFSSLILFLQYSAELYNAFRMLRWVMGGLGLVGYDALFNILPFTVSGAAVLYYLTHELNLMLAGDELAMSRGVDVNNVKRILFFVVSLMVGSVVAVCGPIGFVGMMMPHIARKLIGADHRWLTPASFLAGGAFLVLCDTLARTLFAPAELPVGILTAFLGGPFFIWLLLREKVDRV